MRTYRSLPIAGVGDFIASVSGSSGDYDITLDDGTVLTAYDETAGKFSTAAPAAADLLLFGTLLESEAISVANAQVLDAEWVAYFFRPEDQT